MSQTDKNWNDLFPLQRFDDIMSYKPDPAATIAGKGWIKKGGCTLVSGQTGIGKTSFVEQLALCCASGSDFLKINIPEAVPTLFLQAESDEEILQRDVLSITQKLNLKKELLSKNFTTRRVFGVRLNDLFNAIETFINECKPAVIFLDNYQSFICGDMNSSQTPAEFALGMNQILIKHDIALVLVAHFGKYTGRDKVARSSPYSVAGSANLPNWARASAEIHTIKGEDSIYRLEFGKNAERTGLVNRSGQPVRSLSIQHSPDQHKPYWSISDNQLAAITSQGMYDREILETMNNNPDLKDGAIAEIVGCDRTTVQRFRTRRLPLIEGCAGVHGCA